MAIQIQFRRDTAANWATANSVLAQGEFGLNLDTSQLKIGDGTTHWTGLAYMSIAVAVTLATPRNIGLSGAVVGTGTAFDGSAAINIPITSVDLTAAAMSGVLGTTHLGSGVANSTTILYGDQTYKIAPVGTTNLGESANATVVSLTSSSGSGNTILTANSTAAGVTTAADYTRLVNTSGTNTGDQATNLAETSNTIAISITSSTGTTASILTANTTKAGVTTSADYNRLVNTSGTNTGDQTTVSGNAGTATNISGGATSKIVYQTAASTTGFITTVNSGVLVTDGSGVPTISTTLPSVLSIPDPRGTSSVAISAAGTTQGGATALTNDYNVITTCAAGAGVVLQTPAANKVVTVLNKGAAACFVYPPSSTAIDVLANNIPIQLPPGSAVTFIGRSATVWDSTIGRLTNAASQVARAYAECVVNPATGVNFESGFYFAATGTGAGWSTSATLPNAITGGAVGILTAACGTVATNVAYMGTGNSLGLTFTMGSGIAVYESRLCVETLSTGTDRYTMYVGFSSDTSGAPSSGCFFRYVDNVNTGKWQCVTRIGGTETTADSGIIVAASSTVMNKFRIEVNAAASSVAFYYNGALVATSINNIPTGTNRECGFGNFFLKSVGTTNSNIFACDYAEATMNFTTPR
jgi:hypothetical protein